MMNILVVTFKLISKWWQLTPDLYHSGASIRVMGRERFRSSVWDHHRLLAGPGPEAGPAVTTSDTCSRDLKDESNRDER